MLQERKNFQFPREDGKDNAPIVVNYRFILGKTTGNSQSSPILNVLFVLTYPIPSQINILNYARFVGERWHILPEKYSMRQSKETSVAIVVKTRGDILPRKSAIGCLSLTSDSSIQTPTSKK